jgi:feruloyl-CoA synthase
LNFDPAGFAPADVCCATQPDGSVVLASPLTLPATPELLPARLTQSARVAPDRVLLAERDGDGWRTLSYATAQRLSAAVGAMLLQRGLDRERPVLIFAEASRAQLLLRLGAMRAGIPFVPASPALLRFADARRLRALLAHVTPGLIALSPACAALLNERQQELGIDPASRVMLDDAFVAQAETATGAEIARLAAAEDAVGPDTLAAVFLTSGSTGEPKGVAVTQRMIAANQLAYAAVWRFLAQKPPVILDWLPWHHTFGGNDNLHKALWFGGTYYIDDGQPTPERFARSIANIRDVRPSIHLNVPRGLALLVDRLETDAELFARFFERLDLIFFAAAGLEAELWRRLCAVVARAAQARGRPIALVSGYGTTESGSTTCLVHFPIDDPRIVGLPIPGLSLRLVPEGDKCEARIKGPMVFPEYWRDPQRTAAAFDADGWYRTGDALRFVDPHEPARGLVFDGRIAEDFKLSSGTWVSVGPLRLALLAALAPHVRDLLVAGHDRDRVAVILFLAPGVADAPHTRVAIAAALARHNRRSPTSSTAVMRALIDPAFPSADSGELSDKGTINQRASLRNRAALVHALYSEPVPAGVILPDARVSPP